MVGGSESCWKSLTVVEHMRGFLRLIAKSWSDPCKHQLSQKVNMAPYHLVTRLLRNFLGPCEVVVRWSGAAGRMRTLPPSFPRLPIRATLVRLMVIRCALLCGAERDMQTGKGTPRHAWLHRCHTYICSCISYSSSCLTYSAPPSLRPTC